MLQNEREVWKATISDMRTSDLEARTYCSLRSAQTVSGVFLLRGIYDDRRHHLEFIRCSMRDESPATLTFAGCVGLSFPIYWVHLLASFSCEMFSGPVAFPRRVPVATKAYIAAFGGEKKANPGRLNTGFEHPRPFHMESSF